MKTAIASVDDYIAGFPPAVAKRLMAMRTVIRKHAPKAEERMAYGIPTFSLNGNLVHFGGFERHVGFYPGPSGITAFQDALAHYKSAKGSVQFPHDEPLPLKLVGEIVAYRVKENGAKKKKVARKNAP